LNKHKPDQSAGKQPYIGIQWPAARVQRDGDQARSDQNRDQRMPNSEPQQDTRRFRKILLKALRKAASREQRVPKRRDRTADPKNKHSSEASGKSERQTAHPFYSSCGAIPAPPGCQ